MDIIAHGLWTGAAVKAVSLATGEKLNMWWAVFFGVAPDLFSFGIFFIQNFVARGFARPQFFDDTVPNPNLVPSYVSTLYHWTHSLVVFAAVFLVVSLIARRPVWELSAWGLHIFIDIPTHTSAFFPTPFLWPLSTFHVSGISWASPVFLFFNYLAILASYIVLFFKSFR